MMWMTISEAAKRIPTTSGKAVGTATVWRWIKTGCKGVKLEHVRFGRRIAVSEDALDRFARGLSLVWTGTRSDRSVKSCGKTKVESRTAAEEEQKIAAAEATHHKRDVRTEQGK